MKLYQSQYVDPDSVYFEELRMDEVERINPLEY